ncbi:cathepsin 7-like, partial [Trifolium medium]|nr:cathepsin 7-like [Trifolium medium]
MVLSPQDIYQSLVKSREEDEVGKSLQNAFAWMKYGGCVSEESCPYRETWQPLDDPPQR